MWLLRLHRMQPFRRLVAQLSVHDPAVPALVAQLPFVTLATVSANKSFTAAAMLFPCANCPLPLCRSHQRLSHAAVHPCSCRGKDALPLHVLPRHGTFLLEHSRHPATDVSRHIVLCFWKQLPNLPCMAGLSHVPSAHLLRPPPNILGGQSAALRDGHTFDWCIKAHKSWGKHGRSACKRAWPATHPREQHVSSVVCANLPTAQGQCRWTTLFCVFCSNHMYAALPS